MIVDFCKTVCPAEFIDVLIGDRMIRSQERFCLVRLNVPTGISSWLFGDWKRGGLE